MLLILASCVFILKCEKALSLPGLLKQAFAVLLRLHVKTQKPIYHPARITMEFYTAKEDLEYCKVICDGKVIYNGLVHPNGELLVTIKCENCERYAVPYLMRLPDAGFKIDNTTRVLIHVVTPAQGFEHAFMTSEIADCIDLINNLVFNNYNSVGRHEALQSVIITKVLAPHSRTSFERTKLITAKFDDKVLYTGPQKASHYFDAGDRKHCSRCHVVK